MKKKNLIIWGYWSTDDPGFRQTIKRCEDGIPELFDYLKQLLLEKKEEGCDEFTTLWKGDFSSVLATILCTERCYIVLWKDGNVNVVKSHSIIGPWPLPVLEKFLKD